MAHRGHGSEEPKRTVTVELLGEEWEEELTDDHMELELVDAAQGEGVDGGGTDGFDGRGGDGDGARDGDGERGPDRKRHGRRWGRSVSLTTSPGVYFVSGFVTCLALFLLGLAIVKGALGIRISL